MKILGLESALGDSSVALWEDGRLLGEYTLQNGNTHSETLLPMTEQILKQFGTEPDAYAVSVGPGSFTGIRIGVATLKGLAFGKNRPCVGVSTLEALAENLSHQTGLIVPVINARRNTVYTALFQAQKGKIKRLTCDTVLPIAELDELLSARHKKIYLVGDGYDLCKQLLNVKTEDTPERLRHATAVSVCVVAERKIAEGQSKSDSEILPVYLKPTQAERERNEKLK